MDKNKLPEWVLTLIILAVACTLSFILRIILPYQSVFDGQWIKLISNDAYFYMRMVDNLLHNFPSLYGFDPYLLFSGGFFTANFPAFFAYLLAGSIKLFGGATPSQQTADTIAVYVPAIIGILTVIPVYFIGRALINRWAGLVAAILVAVMPGEFLSRSLLGNTDHHGAEILLTTCFAVFFTLAIKHGRQFTYSMLKNGQFPAASRYVPYGLAAGLFLGLYLVTWTGALLFVFIICLYFIIQFISDHLRGVPTDYLSKIAITSFLVALLIFLPVSRDKLTLLVLAVIILAPIILNVMSAVMAGRGARPAYYPAAVAVLIGITAFVAWLVFPAQVSSAIYYFHSMFVWRTEQNVVGEMKSLFFPGGAFTLDMAWSQFALVFYSGLAGLALLVYRSIRKGEPELIFITTWSIVVLFASFAMIRFSAYFSVCLALVTGYLMGSAVGLFTKGNATEQQEKSRKKMKKPTAPPRTSLRLALTFVGLSLTFIIFLIPGTANAIAQSRNPGHTPSNAWMEAMQWMKNNTPEPFGASDFYYALYDTPPPGKAYAYPDTAYGVAVWSDYGYWVTRIGHRMPVCNPGYSGDAGEQLYFTSQDEQVSASLMKKWKARYVVIDNRIASPNDKFYALANLSGKKETDFYELCWQKKEGKYVPLLVFYPEFYRSTVVRLYNFDGKLIVPQNTLVMAQQEQVLPDGQKFKEITGLRSFKSYTEAEVFISNQKGGSYNIIGVDPLSSPVPLAPMPGYAPVYQSVQKVTSGTTQIPEIKIFEYKAPVY